MPVPMPTPQLGALGGLMPPQMPSSGIVQQLLAQGASPPSSLGGINPMLMTLLMQRSQQAQGPGRPSSTGTGPSPSLGPSESFAQNGLSQELLNELPQWWKPRTVTWHGVTLNPRAMKSFQRASQIVGAPITVTGSFRSLADQQDIYARKPGVAAPPGHSFHQTGLAFDLNMDDYPAGSAAYNKVVRALERLGWHRFSPDGEPWHFSFRVTG